MTKEQYEEYLQKASKDTTQETRKGHFNYDVAATINKELREALDDLHVKVIAKDSSEKLDLVSQAMQRVIVACLKEGDRKDLTEEQQAYLYGLTRDLMAVLN